MTQKEYRIVLRFGSKYQELVWKRGFEVFLETVKSFFESRHKQNSLEFEETKDNPTIG